MQDDNNCPKCGNEKPEISIREDGAHLYTCSCSGVTKIWWPEHNKLAMMNKLAGHNNVGFSARICCPYIPLQVTNAKIKNE